MLGFCSSRRVIPTLFHFPIWRIGGNFKCFTSRKLSTICCRNTFGIIRASRPPIPVPPWPNSPGRSSIKRSKMRNIKSQSSCFIVIADVGANVFGARLGDFAWIGCKSFVVIYCRPIFERYIIKDYSGWLVKLWQFLCVYSD